ncbi:unnamed protein product [Penicillium roqueforti FM164]|uniref:Uncharacterized protein n=1 Tax=Penicillium roqueforti (strain FM164) TaxID=1365484 RepID=W6QK84_PENRF|nr:unnamed protein product [Penicillium roqueforti FM164]
MALSLWGFGPFVAGPVVESRRPLKRSILELFCSRASNRETDQYQSYRDAKKRERSRQRAATEQALAIVSSPDPLILSPHIKSPSDPVIPLIKSLSQQYLTTITSNCKTLLSLHSLSVPTKTTLATAFRGVPDFIILDSYKAIKVIGEAKTPWDCLSVNILATAILTFGDGEERRYLGQLAGQMRELDLKYAFLTTYDETIFVREVDVGSHWS